MIEAGKFLSLTACAFLAVAVAGCGDDDKSTDKTAGPADADVMADAVEVMSVIRASAVSLDFDSLLTNPQTIPGERGELVITLTTWTFAGYSPDGNVQFDGVLNLGILSAPITMRGDLLISGSKEADVGVDMTIAFVPDPENADALDLELGGTVTYNGVRFQVDDLLQASEPEQEGTDG